MSAVTLAVTMENEYLGFDFAEEMVAEAGTGDIVSLTYDFGAGEQRIVGTFIGREVRDTDEVFVWVEDHTHTRYAIPMGMVEGLRIEARAAHLPTVEKAAGASSPRRRARAHRTLDGLPAAAFGRSCARLDYEGQGEF